MFRYHFTLSGSRRDCCGAPPTSRLFACWLACLIDCSCARLLLCLFSFDLLACFLAGVLENQSLEADGGLSELIGISKISHWISLVNFQNENEPQMASGVHFLFENRSLVDFSNGTEQHMAYGAHLLFKNKSLVNFQKKNGHYMASGAHSPFRKSIRG